MRRLTIHEMKTTAGAAPEDYLLAAGVALGISALALSSPTYYYPTYSYPYYSYPTYYPEVYEISTPVFDDYGYYVGNIYETVVF